MKTKQILFLAFTLPLLATLNASADAIPYSNIGNENLTLYSFTASNTGDINAYFYGSTASYENTLSLLVNGVVTPETAAGVLNDHSSLPGEFVRLGSANTGDILIFRLNVLSTKTWYYSNKVLNADGINHIYSTSFSGDFGLGIPAGTYLAFEDLNDGGDFNYHDENFVFTNITTAVPEPTTYVMMLAGLGLIGFSSRRHR